MAPKNQNSLKNKLEEKTNEIAPKPKTLDDYMQEMVPAMQQAAPANFDINRLTRLALTLYRTTPALKNCNVSSFLGAVMQSAQLGLEPGMLGQCYIIPYGKEATFIIGYRGMIDLARRSGNIKTIYAHPVYQNDDFEYEYGLNPTIKHKPAMENRGGFIGAYAVAHFNDGGYQFEFMSKEEIDKRKLRSKAYKSGPWQTDYEEMAMKTVIRHMFKYLPISIDILANVARDETIKRTVEAEPVSVYEGSFDAEGVTAEDIPMDKPTPAEKQPEGKDDELARVAKEFDEGLI
ncbi:recombination protein RecT [Aneurinibacillus aneurinilyticus]|uniref:recombination protein RecT n=1 Tax=Aneurinibacillus aneurinilyticus TaxID=1391 RepID=UPI003523D99A